MRRRLVVEAFQSFPFEALAETSFLLEALPDGVRYTIAIRRAVRSALGDGIPIEDVGVPGIPYAMTRDDLANSNRDLIAFCAKQLTPVT